MLADFILVLSCAGFVLGAARGLVALSELPFLTEWRAALGLTALVVLAYAARLSIGGHHAMYVDEPMHLEAARRWLLGDGPTLLETSAAGLAIRSDYPKTVGMPALLVPAFALFGARREVAFGLVTTLSLGAIPLSAWVARRLGARAFEALLPATLIAGSALHVAWSRTAETNAPAATLALLAVGCALPARDSTRRRAALEGALGGVAALLAVALRAEAAVVLPGLAALAWQRALTPRGRLAVALVAVATAALARALVAPTAALNTSLYDTPYLALEHLVRPHARSFRPADDLAGCVMIVASAAVGLSAGLLRPRGVNRAALVAVAALGFAPLLAVGAFIRMQPRMLLLPLVLLAPLAAPCVGIVARAVERLVRGSRGPAAATLAAHAAVVGLCVVAYDAGASAREAAQFVPETQQLETRLPDVLDDVALEPDAQIVVEWPTVLAAAHEGTFVATRAFLAAPSLARPTYFVCDMFCEAGYAGGGHACPQMLAHAQLVPVASRRLAGRRYSLLRVRALGPDEPAAAGTSIGCPFVEPPGDPTGAVGRP